MQVLVAVADAAAVQEGDVIEQRAVAVGRRLQPLQIVGQQLDVERVHHYRSHRGWMRVPAGALLCYFVGLCAGDCILPRLCNLFFFCQVSAAGKFGLPSTATTAANASRASANA